MKLTCLLLAVTLWVVESKKLPSDLYCDTFGPGMGYPVACGSCFCDLKGRPVCQRRPSFRCSQEQVASLKFPNKCGKSNLRRIAMDGCNYIRCGNTTGAPVRSTTRGCDDTNSPCKDKEPGYYFYDPMYWGCRKCVCTASGKQFCKNTCRYYPHYPNPYRAYCSRYAPGIGFFDEDTCQTCVCDWWGKTRCFSRTRHPSNLRLKCVPKDGATVKNICKTSNYNKMFFDGCNTALCGEKGTWPVKTYTRNTCSRSFECKYIPSGWTAYNKKRETCVCSISGVLICARTSSKQ